MADIRGASLVAHARDGKSQVELLPDSEDKNVKNEEESTEQMIRELWSQVRQKI